MIVQRCSSYGEAIRAALKWLKEHEGETLAESFEARSGAFGMRSATRSAGYRLEFDAVNGAHINVWSKKVEGPHFVFPGNEADVRAKWRQLFYELDIKKRSCTDYPA
jgi:hypothetical protein